MEALNTGEPTPAPRDPRIRLKVWFATAGAMAGAAIASTTGLAEALSTLLAGLAAVAGWSMGPDERRAVTVLVTAGIAGVMAFGAGWAKGERAG